MGAYGADTIYVEKGPKIFEIEIGSDISFLYISASTYFLVSRDNYCNYT